MRRFDRGDRVRIIKSANKDGREFVGMTCEVVDAPREANAYVVLAPVGRDRPDGFGRSPFVWEKQYLVGIGKKKEKQVRQYAHGDRLTVNADNCFGTPAKVGDVLVVSNVEGTGREQRVTTTHQPSGRGYVFSGHGLDYLEPLDERKAPAYKPGDRVVVLKEDLAGTPEKKGAVLTVTKVTTDLPGVVSVWTNSTERPDEKDYWVFESRYHTYLLNIGPEPGTKEFAKGDRVIRTGPHIFASRDYGDRECVVGSVGTVVEVEERYVRVQWDTRKTSCIDKPGLTRINRVVPPQPAPEVKTMVSVPKDKYDAMKKELSEMKTEIQRLRGVDAVAEEAHAQLARARRERDAVVATLAEMKRLGFDKMLEEAGK